MQKSIKVPNWKAVAKFTKEFNQLVGLIRKYRIPIDISKIPVTPWRETLSKAITHFDPEDYDQLFEQERDSLVTALKILKKTSNFLNEYNRTSVEQVFIDCDISDTYYRDILSEVFDS